MELPQLVNAVITADNLDKLQVVDYKNAKRGFIINLLNVIPVVGGVLASETTTVLDAVSAYREEKFLRKMLSVVYGIQNISKDELVGFLAELEAKSQDFSGNVMADLIDKIDNINKGLIVANLIKSRVEGRITMEDFFRLTSILERIPYVDLNEMLKYQQPYYSPDGDTELLYATGALKLHTIDAGKNDLYILSNLGVKLLEAGLGYTVTADNSGGIDIPHMITFRNIEDTDAIKNMSEWHNGD